MGCLTADSFSFGAFSSESSPVLVLKQEYFLGNVALDSVHGAGSCRLQHTVIYMLIMGLFLSYLK